MIFLIKFIILSFINVVFATVNKITTIKSGTQVAAIISGAYFAFYNIVLIWTVADFPLWQKCLVTLICNYLGVVIVKTLEKKKNKNKLWKVDATFKTEDIDPIYKRLKGVVPCNYAKVGATHYAITCYCSSAQQKDIVGKLVKELNGRYFVSENGGLLI